MHRHIHIQKIIDPSPDNQFIAVGVLRLDLIHPIVSGNKLFKLEPYLQHASEKGAKSIITFGGPFSNHLHATAWAAREKGIKAHAIIKGPEPEKLTGTLTDCRAMGMELIFMEQEAFQQLDNEYLQLKYPKAIIIPQGGYGRIGAEGAAGIMSLPGVAEYDTILAACGTGTMGAGLIMGATADQEIILVSVLKNNFSIGAAIAQLLNETEQKKRYSIEHRFHLGGYARKNSDLFDTMNRIHATWTIPTDFVYTGKLFYAFEHMLQEQSFLPHAKILLIHSGGLQGNRSLLNNELGFGVMN